MTQRTGNHSCSFRIPIICRKVLDEIFEEADTKALVHVSDGTVEDKSKRTPNLLPRTDVQPCDGLTLLVIVSSSSSKRDWTMYHYVRTCGSIGRSTTSMCWFFGGIRKSHKPVYEQADNDGVRACPRSGYCQSHSQLLHDTIHMHGRGDNTLTPLMSRSFIKRLRCKSVTLCSNASARAKAPASSILLPDRLMDWIIRFFRSMLATRRTPVNPMRLKPMSSSTSRCLWGNIRHSYTRRPARQFCILKSLSQRFGTN